MSKLVQLRTAILWLFFNIPATPNLRQQANEVGEATLGDQ